MTTSDFETFLDHASPKQTVVEVATEEGVEQVAVAETPYAGEAAIDKTPLTYDLPPKKG